MPLNLVFTASLLDAQHGRDGFKQCGDQAGKFTCFVVVGTHLGDLAPGLRSSETNIAAVASRWRHCVRFDRPGNRTWTYCSNSDVVNNYYQLQCKLKKQNLNRNALLYCVSSLHRKFDVSVTGVGITTVKQACQNLSLAAPLVFLATSRHCK